MSGDADAGGATMAGGTRDAIPHEFREGVVGCMEMPMRPMCGVILLHSLRSLALSPSVSLSCVRRGRDSWFGYWFGENHPFHPINYSTFPVGPADEDAGMPKAATAATANRETHTNRLDAHFI